MNDDVLSRQSLLVMSIAVSLLLHALLIVMAPSITLIRARSTQPVELPIRMHLIDAARFGPREAASNAEISQLASRPEKIEDLIKRTAEPLVDTSGSQRFAEVPRLEQRTAGRDLSREYDTGLSFETLSKVDSKIVEIEERAAREEIKIARRVVSPSNTRIVNEGEYPTLRGDSQEAGSGVLSIDPFVGIPTLQPSEDGSQSAGAMMSTSDLVNEILAAAPAISELSESDSIGSEVRAQIERESAQASIDEFVNVDLTTYVSEQNAQGYFRVRIAPDKEGSLTVLPKSLTLVVDASSSIAQPKLDMTIKGILASLSSLKPEDRFNIVVFRDQATPFRPEPVSASPENISEARQFLSGIKASGETNVYEAIRPLLQTPALPGAANVVILVSDGRPTEGVKDAQIIINDLTDENARKNTIFAVGGGRTVNRYLLDLLAYRNRGDSSITSKIENLDDELPKVVSNLSDPILVQCEANFIQLDSDEIFPKDLADFYRGRALTIYGVFDSKTDKEFILRLTGQAGDSRKELIFRAKFEDAATGDEEIARNWAFRKAFHIIGEMCRVGETPEALAELRDLSTQYRINTIYNQQ